MNYPETVSILTAPTPADRYGDTEPDWSNPGAVTVTAVGFGVQVQPSESTEAVVPGRQSVVTHMRLITPKGRDLDLSPVQRVRWAGADWMVDGEIARHKSPSTGAVHHVEVTLKRVLG